MTSTGTEVVVMVMGSLTCLYPATGSQAWPEAPSVGDTLSQHLSATSEPKIAYGFLDLGFIVSSAREPFDAIPAWCVTILVSG